MSNQIVRPARNLQGSLTLPGDKSISHRYAMLAGLAEGTTRLSNFSTGADPHSSLACMEALGATVVKKDKTIEVTGVAGAFRQPEHPLDCGNSGSTMRMLAGLIAPHPHTFILIGDHSLSARPMERIRKPLSQMGAEIHLTGGDGAVGGHAPMTIVGGPLTAIDFDTPIPSAQVKTAVLFAGLQAHGTTSLSESVRTRDHSEHALKAFGATLTREADKLSIPGQQKLKAIDATVPGDLSSAAFFLCAALLFPDSNLVLDSLGMNPTRAALLDVITASAAGSRCSTSKSTTANSSAPFRSTPLPAGSRASPSPARSQLSSSTSCPSSPPSRPTRAKASRIRDAKELRVKESDRIALVAKNLKAMGAEFTEHEDGLTIPGNQQLHGAQIDSGSDHRIAMAFSIAALRASGDTEIQGAEAAAISFPEFFTYLDTLAQR